MDIQMMVSPFNHLRINPENSPIYGLSEEDDKPE
jgi:hypothetical protein